MLCVADLVKSYDSSGRKRRRADPSARVRAVDGLSFEVQEGELFTLLGPSGCGKTTTLRSVAGLERPDSGRITLGGGVLFDGAGKVHVPANRRGLGMVFQSYAIWPHLTVFKNVSFPLEVKRLGRKETAERVARALEATELGEVAGRPATRLSGGQQQRLALARALVTEPSMLLLDEPLSNLDAKLRESMRLELKRLQRELGLTAVYVTHDQAEALVMSSRIAVMNEGRIEQIGKPREIYREPRTRFVAEFIGTSNLIEATVAVVDNEAVAVDTPEGRFLSARRPGAELAVGQRVLMSLRPESVAVSDRPPGDGPNTFRGQVLTRAYLGDATDHVIEVGGLRMRCRSHPNVSLPPGTEVSAVVDPSDVVLVAG